MHRNSWGAAALAAAIAFGSASLFVRAADDAKPAAADASKAETKAEGEKKPAAATKKPARLTKPWSSLTSLTDDQSTKIREIHRKALDEINAIEEREKAEIMALLTDAQKSELKAVAESDSAAKKAATKKPKKEDAAETVKPAEAASATGKDAAPTKAP